MKTFILVFSLIATTALPVPFSYQSGPDLLAQKVVAAFRIGSPEEYIALLPTLTEIHACMDRNRSVYGEHLSAAKEEFATRYNSEIVISAKESFKNILEEGRIKGIDWGQIHFERVECDSPNQDLKLTSFTVLFSSKGREYRLKVDKAFIMLKEWKMNIAISLG